MKTFLIFTRAISKKKKVRFLSSAKHFEMSSAVLDKHVDSFGPELLNEAWRGTASSFARPVGAGVSSSPPGWVEGRGGDRTGVGGSLSWGHLNRLGRQGEDVFTVHFSFFLSNSYC